MILLHITSRDECLEVLRQMKRLGVYYRDHVLDQSSISFLWDVRSRTNNFVLRSNMSFVPEQPDKSSGYVNEGFDYYRINYPGEPIIPARVWLREVEYMPSTCPEDVETEVLLLI